MPQPLTSQLGSAPIDSRTVRDGLRSAITGDAPPIHDLIQWASESTTVLPRSLESISTNIQDFIVAIDQGVVAGCGALHITFGGLAEIRSLVVAASARGRGFGNGIIRELIAEARKRELKRVFVLTDSPDLFARHGFQLASRDSFPHKVWNECVLCPRFNDCNEVALDLILNKPH